MTNATSPEYINSVNDIIQGIARRSAFKFKTKDAEELAQELWVHILEIDAEKGPLDLDLVANICYKKIVDIQRYEMRRNHVSLDDTRMLDRGGDESDGDIEFTFVPIFSGTAHDAGYISGEEFDIKLTVDDLFRIFPQGSKERLFLEYWSTAAKVKDFGIKADKFNESTLAKLLGFESGTSHRGYKRFRGEMRDFVGAYFGYHK